MIVVSHVTFHIGLMIGQSVEMIKNDRALNLLFRLVSGYK
jgi:hypothetical protein